MKKQGIEISVPGREDSNLIRSLSKEVFKELDSDIYKIVTQVFDHMRGSNTLRGVVKTSFTIDDKGVVNYFKLILYVDKERNSAVVISFKKLTIDQFIDYNLEADEPDGGVNISI